VEGAVRAGLSRARTRFFTTPSEAAQFLETLVAPGDLLLVKGSRGVKMEQIVDALIARHAVSRQEVRH
jgi:UDP-N-acetylmuramoyl-tripeptide--D-alanyl-D-alanine ligase